MQLLPPAQTAKCLAISIRTLHRMRDQGKLLAVTVGAKPRYREEDINDYIQRNTDKPGERRRLTGKDIVNS